MFDIFTPTRMQRGITTRTFNAENPEGRKGAAAQAASRLGVGRKGSPAADLQPGQELVLADVEGPGIIRHLWITCNAITEADPFVYRNLVLKMYWDGAAEPSVVAPRPRLNLQQLAPLFRALGFRDDLVLPQVSSWREHS